MFGKSTQSSQEQVIPIRFLWVSVISKKMFKERLSRPRFRRNPIICIANRWGFGKHRTVILILQFTLLLK